MNKAHNYSANHKLPPNFHSFSFTVCLCWNWATELETLFTVLICTNLLPIFVIDCNWFWSEICIFIVIYRTFSSCMRWLKWFVYGCVVNVIIEHNVDKYKAKESNHELVLFSFRSIWNSRTKETNITFAYKACTSILIKCLVLSWKLWRV